MPAAYVTPDGSAAGRYVGWRRRTVAAVVDWVLCFVLYLIASLVAGVIGAIPVTGLDALAQLLAVAPVVAYFAYFLRTGSTLGMRAADIEIVVAATGRPPGTARSLIRALLAFLIGASAYIGYFVGFSFDPPLRGYSTTDRALAAAATAIVSLAALAKLWALVDSRGQSLENKPFGLVIVEDVAPTVPEPSPWSGLWERAP